MILRNSGSASAPSSSALASEASRLPAATGRVGSEGICAPLRAVLCTYFKF